MYDNPARGYVQIARRMHWHQCTVLSAADQLTTPLTREPTELNNMTNVSCGVVQTAQQSGFNGWTSSKAIEIKEGTTMQRLLQCLVHRRGLEHAGHRKEI